jgi:ATP-binding cassette subfamily F protein uup
LASETTVERAVPAAPRSSESPQTSGAELRAAEKELGAIDRKLARLADQIAAKHRELADHDQSDHVGIARLTEQLRDLEGGVTELENRWMEVSEILE